MTTPPRRVLKLELYVNRCVGMIAFRVDGQLGWWPLNLPASAVPHRYPKR